MEEILTSAGQDVLAVASVDAALEAYGREYFPVVVTDWLMEDGDLDGLDLCRSIRSSPRGSHTFILVVTVRDAEGDLNPVLDAGADDYLSKPFDPKLLHSRVRIARERITQQIAREDAELALQVSERRLRSVVSNAPLVLMTLDRDGVFTFAAGQGLESLGMTPDELIGRSVYEVWKNDPDVVANVNRARSGEEFRVNDLIRNVALESWYAPVRGHGPHAGGVIIVSTDVTDRRRVEEEIREGEERFRRFVEAAFEGIAIIEDGRIIDCNDQIATMVGYDRDQLQGMRVSQLIHPDDRDAATEWLDAPRPNPIEHRIVRQDGSSVPVEVRMRSTHLRGREVVMAAVHDISERQRSDAERQRLEERLRQSQRLESLGVMAGGIAHDFNNLLMGVLGNASLALLDLDPASPVSAFVQQIEESAQRAAELTNQMLAFSGKGKFVVTMVSLSDLIRANRSELDATLGPDVNLELRLDEEVPAVEGDYGQLSQVIASLVANASEAYAEGGGQVTVTTGVRRVDRQALADAATVSGDLLEGDRVYLEVQDHGCGMDEETASKIFDPFFTTKFAGRGLGMAAVMGIVQSHGGMVKVETGEGTGTTVTVYFPVAEDRVEAADGIGEDGGDAAGGHGQTVLVIDDEPTVRDVTSAMLSRRGHRVLCADSGHAGLEQFAEHRANIGVILLDLTMPDMSGETVYREVSRRAPGTRVVLMSGYDEQEATNRFSSQGLAGFIQKPFTAEDLNAKIDSILAEQT